MFSLDSFTRLFNGVKCVAGEERALQTIRTVSF